MRFWPVPRIWRWTGKRCGCARTASCFRKTNPPREMRSSEPSSGRVWRRRRCVLAQSGVEPARARSLLQILLRERQLVRVSDDLVFHRSAIENLRQMMASRRSARFNVAVFKEWTGISRKYAIPLLEYLDREHVTRREGDERLVL